LTTLASEGLAPVSPGWRGLTASPYAILDVAATRGALDAAVASVSERAAIRPAAVPVLRHAYAEGRAMIAAGIAATPTEAHRSIHDYCWLLDQIVTLTLDLANTWMHPLPTPTASERICAIAVGGYGRGEMAPFSDVDLLFVTPYKQTPWGESLIESVL
jgi:[protein-PII] uridylyltransferase